MASFRAVRRALCTAAEAAPAPTPAPAPAGRWERLKQSKAGVWCRSLLSDYKEACREVLVGAKERPLKASVYVGLLGGAYACFCTKPDQTSFQATLLDRSNQLALLSPWIRNGASDLHVQNLVKLRNQGCLRHLSLGLFSLVYSADHDPQSALYEATCPNLSVPWRELPGRVLDVGFVGRWWVLDKKMEDFDVNDAEYKHLPTHMQATAPPSVQEVERNEQLHKASWLPITVHEEDEDTAAGTGGEKEQTQAEAEDVEVDTAPMDTVEETRAEAEDVEVDTAPMDTKEETQAETEDVEVDTAPMDTREETQVDIQLLDNQSAETLDFKDIEVKSSPETLDTKEEMQLGHALDIGGLETKVEVVEETEVDISAIEVVDTVAMETVDTNKDGDGEEEEEKTEAQSLKN